MCLRKGIKYLSFSRSPLRGIIFSPLHNLNLREAWRTVCLDEGAEGLKVHEVNGLRNYKNVTSLSVYPINNHYYAEESEFCLLHQMHSICLLQSYYFSMVNRVVYNNTHEICTFCANILQHCTFSKFIGTG